MDFGLGIAPWFFDGLLTTAIILWRFTVRSMKNKMELWMKTANTTPHFALSFIIHLSSFSETPRPGLILNDFKGIIPNMSYKTVEVELENGRVQATGAETLPEKAHGLLTILTPPTVRSEAPAKSLGKAMRELAVSGRGEFTDLSTNPRHMDEFGK